MTLTTPRNLGAPASGAKPPIAPPCGTALNKALDFSKLQEAMVEGQCLSVSARAKLLESPFAKPEPAPNSVQKLAQQFAGVRIAPPQTEAKKALHFGTPGKVSSEPSTSRIALGELRQNPRTPNLASTTSAGSDKSDNSADDKSAEIQAEVSETAIQEQPSSPQQEVGNACLDQDAAEAIGVTGASDEDAAVLRSERDTKDCVEMVSDIADVVESIETIETATSDIPALLGHNVDVVDDALDSSSEANVSEASVAVDDPIDDAEKPETVAEDDPVLSISHGIETIPDGEEKEPIDDAEVGEVLTEVAAPEESPEMGAEEPETVAEDDDGSIETIPDGDEAEDAVYAAAIDEAAVETDDVDLNILDQTESDALAPLLCEFEAEPHVEVGADARSQAITVTETSMQQQNEVCNEDESSAGEAIEVDSSEVDEIQVQAAEVLQSSSIVQEGKDPEASTEREPSPAPAPALSDPLSQASVDMRLSLEAAPQRRQSSPMEDHLKLVVKSTVVGYCSEVEEQNVLLNTKIEYLELQLAKTNAHLAACATKEQMDQMQELLREAIAARDTGSASCRGCTIC